MISLPLEAESKHPKWNTILNNGFSYFLISKLNTQISRKSSPPSSHNNTQSNFKKTGYFHLLQPKSKKRYTFFQGH